MSDHFALRSSQRWYLEFRPWVSWLIVVYVFFIPKNYLDLLLVLIDPVFILNFIHEILVVFEKLDYFLLQLVKDCEYSLSLSEPLWELPALMFVSYIKQNDNPTVFSMPNYSSNCLIHSSASLEPIPFLSINFRNPFIFLHFHVMLFQNNLRIIDLRIGNPDYKTCSSCLIEKSIPSANLPQQTPMKTAFLFWWTSSMKEVKVALYQTLCLGSTYTFQLNSSTSLCSYHILIVSFITE